MKNSKSKHRLVKPSDGFSRLEYKPLPRRPSLDERVMKIDEKDIIGMNRLFMNIKSTGVDEQQNNNISPQDNPVDKSRPPNQIHSTTAVSRTEKIYAQQRRGTMEGFKRQEKMMSEKTKGDEWSQNQTKDQDLGSLAMRKASDNYGKFTKKGKSTKMSISDLWGNSQYRDIMRYSKLGKTGTVFLV
jgi:hypothetical protein